RHRGSGLLRQRVPPGRGVRRAGRPAGAGTFDGRGAPRAVRVTRLSAGPPGPPGVRQGMTADVKNRQTLWDLLAIIGALVVASSVTMVCALRALARGEEVVLVKRLVLTAGLGALFLLVQGYEWARLIGYGLTVSAGAYGATFYTLIGAHALHVFGALVWLSVTLVLAARVRFRHGRTAPVKACAMFWH